MAEGCVLLLPQAAVPRMENEEDRDGAAASSRASSFLQGLSLASVVPSRLRAIITSWKETAWKETGFWAEDSAQGGAEVEGGGAEGAGRLVAQPGALVAAPGDAARIVELRLRLTVSCFSIILCLKKN